MFCLRASLHSFRHMFSLARLITAVPLKMLTFKVYSADSRKHLLISLKEILLRGNAQIANVWSIHATGDGIVFFYDKVSKKSQWVRPTQLQKDLQASNVSLEQCKEQLTITPTFINPLMQTWQRHAPQQQQQQQQQQFAQQAHVVQSHQMTGRSQYYQQQQYYHQQQRQQQQVVQATVISANGRKGASGSANQPLDLTN